MGKCPKHLLEITKVSCFAIDQMKTDSRGDLNHLDQDHLKAELIQKLKIQLGGIHAKKYSQKLKKNLDWLTVFLEGTRCFWKTWRLRSKSSESNNIKYWKKKRREFESSKSKRTGKGKKYKIWKLTNNNLTSWNKKIKTNRIKKARLK